MNWKADQRRRALDSLGRAGGKASRALIESLCYAWAVVYFHRDECGQTNRCCRSDRPAAASPRSIWQRIVVTGHQTEGGPAWDHHRSDSYIEHWSVIRLLRDMQINTIG